MVFLIIFGSRGVTYSAGSGEFFCPGCQESRDYVHRRVRRFFTLYFVPLVPLDVLGEYVECQHCHDTYKLDILALGPAGSDRHVEAEFQTAVKRVMVLVMMADGHIDPQEIETIQLVLGKLVEREVTRAEVDREIERARTDALGIRAYVESVAPRLNDSGKETVVKAAYFVAAADGRIADEETALLAELATALEMSPARFKSIVDELGPSDADAATFDPSGSASTS